MSLRQSPRHSVSLSKRHIYPLFVHQTVRTCVCLSSSQVLDGRSSASSSVKRDAIFPRNAWKRHFRSERPGVLISTALYRSDQDARIHHLAASQLSNNVKPSTACPHPQKEGALGVRWTMLYLPSRQFCINLVRLA